MQLTNWNRPNVANLENYGRTMATVYIKVFSAIICILLFACTLLASCFCSPKIVTQTNNHDDDDD